MRWRELSISKPVRLLLLFATLLVTVPIPSQTTATIGFPVASADSADETSAKQAADAMLPLWDTGKYRAMYRDTFSDYMKKQATEDEWVKMAQDIASKAGKNLGRSYSTSELKWGVYLFTYKSRYEAGNALDQVYVTKQTGEWKINGFFVKPAE
jgi:hypothetical protein